MADHYHRSVDLSRAKTQLAAINEVVTVANQLGVAVWLRGGWATDFFLGRPTRDHDDVDWFTLPSDGRQLAGGLIDRGFADVTTAPVNQQIDLVRGDVEHGIALLQMGDRNEPLVAGGPWAGEPWPPQMLDGPVGRIGKVSCRVIAPLAQIELKQMTPIWNPHLKRRSKDLDDIAAIQHELSIASALHNEPNPPTPQRGSRQGSP